MSHVSSSICLSTVLAVLLGLSTITPPASAQEKPNIVVIWGDDIGQSDISAYTMGADGFHRLPTSTASPRMG